jgi:hypothetical protein
VAKCIIWGNGDQPGDHYFAHNHALFPLFPGAIQQQVSFLPDV